MPVPLRVPPRIVLPSAGELTMRCGRCGLMAFRGHIRPDGAGAGRLTALECVNCTKVYEIDDQARLAGKIDPLDRKGPVNGK